MKNIIDEMNSEYRQETHTRINRIINGFLGAEVKIKNSTEVVKLFGEDEADKYNFGFEIEREFDLTIPLEKINSFKTIGDYKNYLAQEEILKRR